MTLPTNNHKNHCHSCGQDKFDRYFLYYNSKTEQDITVEEAMSTTDRCIPRSVCIECLEAGLTLDKIYKHAKKKDACQKAGQLNITDYQG